MTPLLQSAYRRIAACTWRDFYISAVQYLGIDQKMAREIWRDAHEATAGEKETT